MKVRSECGIVHDFIEIMMVIYYPKKNKRIKDDTLKHNKKCTQEVKIENLIIRNKGKGSQTTDK